MLYKFPLIEHISQVKAAIEGKPEFIVAEREHFDIVNYVVTMPTTFPPAHSERNKILRECRGIVFDKRGVILSRRFHKFFNIGERPETDQSLIDLNTDSGIYLEKLDGSMITPVYIEAFDSFRWCTKMGLSDVALHAEAFVADKVNYHEFARYCHDRGVTPIFEYCSRYNRVVIDYSEERMTLLAIRNNHTGCYTPIGQMVTEAGRFGIPVVQSMYFSGHIDLSHFRNSEGSEGAILRFDNGHMVKLKSDWYVQIHKAKDSLLHEKDVIRMLLADAADDVKSFLTTEERKRLESFETDFFVGVQHSAREVGTLFSILAQVYSSTGDRARFAAEIMGKENRVLKPGTVFPDFWRDILFRMFGKATTTCGNIALANSLIREVILKNLNSQTKVDGVRHLFNAKWNSHAV